MRARARTRRTKAEAGTIGEAALLTQELGATKVSRRPGRRPLSVLSSRLGLRLMGLAPLGPPTGRPSAVMLPAGTPHTRLLHAGALPCPYRLPGAC